MVLLKRLATVEFHMCELAHFFIIAEYSIVFYLFSTRTCSCLVLLRIFAGTI
jgi:hypothetical protein